VIPRASLRASLALVAALLGTSTVHAALAAQQSAPSALAGATAVPANEALGRELQAMLAEDERLRRTDDGSPGAAQRMEEGDSAHVRRLKAIVAERGWPGIAQVGKDAAFAAFIVLQHADGSTQERYLPLLREAAARGDFAPGWLAMLEDRVLWRRGEKQIYGSQVVFTDGHLSLWPVEDEAHVDVRRAGVGMGPLAEYLKGFGITYTPPAP
jgi:hypothetical protein